MKMKMSRNYSSLPLRLLSHTLIFPLPSPLLHPLLFAFRFSRRSSSYHSSGIVSDYSSLQRVLRACKTSLDLKAAVKTHVKIVKLGFGRDLSLVSTLLLTYVNCGQLHLGRCLLDETACWNVDLMTGNVMISSFMSRRDIDTAKKVFRNMPHKDVVSWNSLIGGCVKNSRFEEALKFFKDMCSIGVEPDEYTFSSVISGCARLGALTQALWIHNVMMEKGIALNDICLAALVDMYAKCGKIEMAKKIFDSRLSSNVSVWNAMICGLARYGLASEAISVFSRMKEAGISSDSITFLGILTACSHCGLVELGQRYFQIMQIQYSIDPELEHYGAMVDLYGRAGRLDDAYAIIKSMPIKPDSVIWKTLLSACRSQKNTALGEIAVTKVSSLDAGDYVLLSNTYCSLHKWSSSANIRETMKMDGARKARGKSWIELAGVIHYFKAGKKAHPEMEAIKEILRQLTVRAKLEGFVPETELVLMDVSAEEKEENLNFHSERLALAFGVLKTAPRTELRISKNLRSCSDCHSWFKIVSRMLTRVIIVRDRIRFHKFDGGTCSCGDYW